MARGATHVIGLDIGNESIKLVELAQSKGGVRLLNAPLLISTPPGAVSGGVVTDVSAVSGAVREALARTRLDTRKTVAAVGGDTSALSRVISLPRMTGKELKEAMRFELDRQTPFPADQVVYDYEPLPSAGDEENMEIFLAVGQEDMVNSHVDALRSSKLTPLHIEVEPVALARATAGLSGGQSMEQTVVALDLGATFTGIYIYRRGFPAFIRTIPLAGNSLTDAIREELQLDQAQAEQAKRAFADVSALAYEAPLEEEVGEESYGALYDEGTEAEAETGAETEYTPAAPVASVPAAPKEPQPPEVEEISRLVNEALAQKVFDLVTEITRSVDFYRRQHRDETLAEIVLCGGTAHLGGLAELIAAETGIATRLADPFAQMQTEGKASAAYLRDIGPNLAVAVGLALRDILD